MHMFWKCVALLKYLNLFVVKFCTFGLTGIDFRSRNMFWCNWACVPFSFFLQDCNLGIEQCVSV